MAWILALTIWITSLLIVFVLAGRLWWFPQPISDLAVSFDQHFVFTMALCGFFFVLAQVLLGCLVIRYRSRAGHSASYAHGSKAWVFGVMAAMVLLDASLSRGAGRLWKEQQMTPAPPDAVRLEITGQQFAWNIRYPGADGRFGRTDPTLVNDFAGNPLGIDMKDPPSADDIVLPTLIVPRGRPVEVLLRSKDVIHSFFIRELRIKQDAVPGMQIPVKFTATKAGRYEIACAELCGLGHHRMRSYLEVVEPEQWEARVREAANR
ncbi:MAG: cytochrome c oxidase subunit II [Acidobacteria bacterium]|nr:cytochrome c oxidase subunit II [Acidobacteriota bacterium]